MLMEKLLQKLELWINSTQTASFIQFTIILGAFFVFWKQIKAMFCGLCKIIWILVLKPKEIVDFFTNLQKAMKSVEQISYEFKNNGGSSLRDLLDSIKKDVHIGNERYKIGMDALNTAYYETENDGSCRYVSKSWSKITGLSAKEASGYGWRNGLAEIDRERVSEEFLRCVKESREFDMIFHMIDRDGKLTKVKGHGYPILTSKGALLGFFGTVSPIIDLTSVKNMIPSENGREETS